MRQLRIAQVAPLYERVPPALYGGTERVVSYLTEELVRQGPPRHLVCERRFGDSGAERIEHLIDGEFIRYVGELNDADKATFLRDALALVFPIDWPEPFGLAMIESLACGTPVIAFRRGSVAEVIDDGVSGRVVDDIPAAVRAVDQMASWDRAACRATFERRFTAERMAREYCQLYEALRRRTWRLSS